MKPLSDLQALIARYLRVTDEQRLILALWIVHTYFVQYADQTPYLVVTSPEKQCGKSRLLELLEMLVARPWYTFQASDATLYRRIHNEMPTLLLDEVDAVFSEHAAEYHEGLRAIINAGHRKGATVDRTANFGRTLEQFNVYGAKVLAGIGTVPGTIADRAIPIRLQRLGAGESVERFRRREVLAATQPFREKFAEYATDDRGQRLMEARPAMPDELSDRMQEGCEQLVALADMLGIGEEARHALVVLLTADRLDSVETWREKLLADTRALFYSQPETHAFHTLPLIMQLGANGNGWGEYKGDGLSSARLSALLRPYEIKTKNVRVGELVAKGYHREQFADAWARYLPAYVPPEADAA